MRSNSKILGAFVIGFALVGGSYVMTHFGKTPATPHGDIYAVAAKNDTHTYIPVTDKNNDGIEDWQEEFVNDIPLAMNSNSSSTKYVPPKTITDQMGIQLLQTILEAKGRGGAGADKKQIIADTAQIMKETAIKDTVYTAKDITIIPSSPDAIRTYANTLASILINNDIPNTENELDIFRHAMDSHNPNELAKLDPLINVYKNMRDQTLATPVPQGFEKQHLDLINVYQAIFAGMSDMKLGFSDPVVALLRIKRYPDDAKGLGNALSSMYTALLPYAGLLKAGDPAFTFADYAPQ